MRGATNAQRRDAVKTTTLSVNGCSIIKREYGPMVSYTMQNQTPTATGDFVLDAISGLPAYVLTTVYSNTTPVGLIYGAGSQLNLRIASAQAWTGFALTLIREGGGLRLFLARLMHFSRRC